MRRTLALVSTVLVAGCAADERAPGGRRAAPIIGGERDVGDPAVVLLVSYPPDVSTFYTCTATLIGPRTLVTAAHCLDDVDHAGFQFGAFLGDDASIYPNAAALSLVLVPAVSVHPHPAYDREPPFVADIGVVILETEVDVTPLPIRREPITEALVGEPARIVGYGQVEVGVFNATKHQASTVVERLGVEDTVVVGDDARHTCVGDSGGPALVTSRGVETVIGVDSFSDSPGCTAAAHFRRVDRYLEFLDPFLEPGPQPDDDGGGCRVAPARPAALPTVALLFLAFLLARLGYRRIGDSTREPVTAVARRRRRCDRALGTVPRDSRARRPRGAWHWPCSAGGHAPPLHSSTPAVPAARRGLFVRFQRPG